MDATAIKKLALTLSVINCPNCGGAFHPKVGGGLTNIRCSDCFYEAHFVSVQGVQVLGVFSISASDRERVLEQKIMLPPFILHWTWYNEEAKMQWEVAVHYPFIPHTFLKSPDVPISLLNQTDDAMVFIRDEDLLRTTIYTSPSDEELAELISSWPVRSTSNIQSTFEFGYSRAARILDIANDIRRKKGLPVDDAQDDDE